MTSKELAQELLKPIKNKRWHSNKEAVNMVSNSDLDELEANIELYLLRKFEEGRQVGININEKK